MSVENKKIRELESAAIEAVQAMNELELAELLEDSGPVFLRDRRISNRVERLRLAAIELDRAEAACSRERTLTMSEEEMRQEFEALGLDYDETTERGQAMLQKLLAEYDARREAETQPAVVAEQIHEQYRQTFGSEPAAPSITGVVYPVGAPPELGLTLSRGLGDCGKSETETWYEMVEEQKAAWMDPAVEMSTLVQEVIRLSAGEPAPNVVLLEEGPVARQAAARIHELNQEHAPIVKSLQRMVRKLARQSAGKSSHHTTNPKSAATLAHEGPDGRGFDGEVPDGGYGREPATV
jgi:hypothetical protein